MNGKFLIPEQIGGSEYLFNDAPAIGSVKIIDGVIAGSPGVLSIYILGPFIPNGYEIVTGIISLTFFVAGFLALLLKPNHIGLKEHMERAYRFKFKTDKKRRNVLADGGIQEFVENPDEIVPHDSDELRKLSGIEKFYPNYNVMERPDGTVVAAMRIHGSNLSFSSGEERYSAIVNLATFVNNQLEDIGKIQLFLPMKRFDPSIQIRELSERRDDDDILENKIMQLYLSDRINTLRGYEGNLYREYYILVELTSNEYKKIEIGASRRIERLRRISDALAEIVLEVTSANDLTEEEFKSEQIEQLIQNRNRVMNSIKKLTDNEVEPLTADELGALNAEEWGTMNITESEKEDFLQKQEYTITDYERARAKLNEDDGDTQ